MNIIRSPLGQKVFPACSVEKWATNAKLWLDTLKSPAVREGVHRRLEMKHDTKYFSTPVIMPANSLEGCQVVYSQPHIQCSSWLELTLQGQNTRFSHLNFLLWKQRKSQDSVKRAPITFFNNPQHFCPSLLNLPPFFFLGF